MKRRKAFLACLLAVVMVVGLAACSGNANNGANDSNTNTATTQPSTNSTTSSSTETTTATATDTPPASYDPNVAGEQGLSKYETPVTVRVARGLGMDAKFKPGEDYDNNIWMTEYRDVLGINIETLWTAEGYEAYTQKLNLSIMSGDLPDIIECNASQFTSLVNGGLLQPLGDVLEKWQIPLVRNNLMEDGGEGLSQSTIGGELFALPKAPVYVSKDQFVFVREDWRLALGLPEPKTAEDLHTLAKAFVENDLDGMGAYGYGIGSDGLSTYFGTDAFLNMFGGYPTIWIEKNGKLEYGGIQPEIKNGLAALRQYYDEGLIDPEFVVKDSYAISQDAVAGKVGIASAEWWLATWPLPDGYKLGQNWRAYTIPFDTGVAEKKISSQAKLDARYAVRKGYDHPEALVKMYNLFQDRIFGSVADLTVYKGDGEFNYDGLAIVYTTVGPNRNLINMLRVTEAIDSKDESVLEDLEQRQVYGYIKDWIDGVDKGVDQNATNFLFYSINYGPNSIYGLMDYYNNNNMYKVDEFYGPDTPEMIEKWGTLSTSMTEMIVNVVSGALPLSAFDDFVANWKALGGDTITQEVNDWWNSTK